MGIAGINGGQHELSEADGGYRGQQELARADEGYGIKSILWILGGGLSELVDIKGTVGMSEGQWGLVDIKGAKRNSQILTGGRRY